MPWAKIRASPEGCSHNGRSLCRAACSYSRYELHHPSRDQSVLAATHTWFIMLGTLRRCLLQVAFGVARKAVAAVQRIEVVPRPVVKLPRSGLRIDLFRTTGGHPRLR